MLARPRRDGCRVARRDGRRFRCASRTAERRCWGRRCRRRRRGRRRGDRSTRQRNRGRSTRPQAAPD
ncbi:MAG: hypothetical protein DMF56_09520 [Acidobacteria bacterium]|nr:MAG: hypothetical protein DMF56_09520 [Acidobacteriota bacterium]